MEFSVTTLGKFKVFKLSGKLGWEAARDLDKQIASIIDDGILFILFNLDDVQFICSGAIGAILYNLNRVSKQDGGIYIVSSNDYVNYIFDTTFGAMVDKIMFKSFEDFYEKIETNATTTA